MALFQLSGQLHTSPLSLLYLLDVEVSAAKPCTFRKKFSKKNYHYIEDRLIVFLFYLKITTSNDALRNIVSKYLQIFSGFLAVRRVKFETIWTHGGSNNITGMTKGYIGKK